MFIDECLLLSGHLASERVFPDTNYCFGEFTEHNGLSEHPLFKLNYGVAVAVMSKFDGRKLHHKTREAIRNRLYNVFL